MSAGLRRAHLLLQQLMSDDQEGGAKAQNTADGEQSSDPVLVLQAEGQVLQGEIVVLVIYN